MKAPKKNHSCCENIQQWAHVHKKMMETDVARLCDTKCKTCVPMKDDGNALKRKGLSS
jgi:hypothetical protein